ncbi:hypothetical protein EBS43_09315 [bacterium]|nr:hypothetical protein [bacterium]
MALSQSQLAQYQSLSIEDFIIPLQHLNPAYRGRAFFDIRSVAHYFDVSPWYPKMKIFADLISDSAPGLL